MITDMNRGPVVGLTSRTLGIPAARRTRETETVARTYVEAVVQAGGLPLILPNLVDAEPYLDLIDALLLTGGDDPHPHLFGEEPHPRIEDVDERRDRFEIALVRGAHERGLPVLGICRGVQLMNIALGGDIYQDIASQTDSPISHTQRRADDGPWHRIDVAPDSRLAAVLGCTTLSVNSFHHQACRRPGKGLAISATSGADGLPEAVEDPARPYFLGVQWHPELAGDGGTALFSALVAAGSEYRRTASKDRG